MRKIGRLFSGGSRFPLIVTLFCCIGFLVLAKSSAVQHQVQRSSEEERRRFWEERQSFLNALKVEDVQLKNETSGFNIIQPIEKTPEGSLKLRLRNDYHKTITAYQFTVGVTRTLIDHLGDPVEAGIRPGQIVEQTRAVDWDPKAKSVSLVINAVVFDDGTDDGNPRLVQEIEEIRVGQAALVEYFISTLEEISKSQGIDTLRRLKELKADLLNDDNNLYGGLPVGIRSGRRQKGRELSRYYIDALVTAAQGKGEQERVGMVVDLLRHSETQFAMLRHYAQMKKDRSRIQ